MSIYINQAPANPLIQSFFCATSPHLLEGSGNPSSALVQNQKTNLSIGQGKVTIIGILTAKRANTIGIEYYNPAMIAKVLQNPIVYHL